MENTTDQEQVVTDKDVLHEEQTDSNSDMVIKSRTLSTIKQKITDGLYKIVAQLFIETKLYCVNNEDVNDVMFKQCIKQIVNWTTTDITTEMKCVQKEYPQVFTDLEDSVFLELVAWDLDVETAQHIVQSTINPNQFLIDVYSTIAKLLLDHKSEQLKYTISDRRLRAVVHMGIRRAIGMSFPTEELVVAKKKQQKKKQVEESNNSSLHESHLEEQLQHHVKKMKKHMENRLQEIERVLVKLSEDVDGVKREHMIFVASAFRAPPTQQSPPQQQEDEHVPVCDPLERTMSCSTTTVHEEEEETVGEEQEDVKENESEAKEELEKEEPESEEAQEESENEEAQEESEKEAESEEAKEEEKEEPEKKEESEKKETETKKEEEEEEEEEEPEKKEELAKVEKQDKQELVKDLATTALHYLTHSNEDKDDEDEENTDDEASESNVVLQHPHADQEIAQLVLEYIENVTSNDQDGEQKYTYTCETEYDNEENMWNMTVTRENIQKSSLNDTETDQVPEENETDTISIEDRPEPDSD